MVKANHPQARQALLLREQSRRQLQQARGAFDPKLLAGQDQKTFTGTHYYTHGEAGLKWDSPYALGAKAGYNWSGGLYLNPEYQLPPGGQAVLGFSLPLAQGLLVDERRTALRQAAWMEQLNEAQAQQLRLQLYLDTYKAYWEWSWAYHALLITEEALAVSRERLGNVRASFEQGDYPAIDTLEAFIQVQSWQWERQQAQLAADNARRLLQPLLWTSQGEAQNLPTAWQPWNPALPADELTDAAAFSVNNHPKLREFDAKLAQLELERRWKAEQLKPVLNLEYNLLANRFDFGYRKPDQADGSILLNNTKWGFQFAMPLLLRKERAGLALAEIKISEMDWQRRQVRENLEAQLAVYRQQWTALAEQINLVEQLVDNYRQLLEAEQVKFQLGESSVFLLNSRQQKLLEARLKLLKLQAERRKAAASVRYASGLVP